MVGIIPFLLRWKYGWIAALAILAFSIFGGSLGGIFGGGEQRLQDGKGARGTPEQAEMVQFVSFVLDDAQSTWRQAFAKNGRQYQNAKLVLFTGSTQTGCGYGQAAAGPFYCPADSRVYIDLSFYRELAERFGARGDFAQAYVVAHEIGHHVQNLLGTSDRVHKAPRSLQAGASGLSVRLELQADCYAGVWAHSTSRRDLLEEGDIEEGLGAAAAVGDDRIQKKSTGTVHPESWTHGSAADRARWFRRGYESGAMEACDTFEGASL
jgi:predicted metalloprotease